MTQFGRMRPAWLTVGTLSTAGVLVSMQSMMVVTQLPEVPGIYSVSADDASWALIITLLTGAIATPILARLADMVGKKRMIVISLLTLVVGSLVAVIPLGYGMLLLGRGLQGASAALIPIGISIMRDELSAKRLPFGIALMGATVGFGGSLGIPLSGLLYEAFGFASLFWSVALVGSMVALGVMRVVRESPVRTPGRFDLVGAVVLALGLTGLLLGISKGATWGWLSIPTIVAFSSAFILFAFWFPTQLRTRVPMVELRTAFRRPVLLTNVAGFASNLAMFANLLITAQMLQQPVDAGGFGLSPMDTGLMMFFPAFTWMVMSAASGVLLSRLGARNTLLIGSSIAVAAYVFRVLIDDTVADVIVGSCLVYLGTAMASAALPSLIMSSVPLTETASANGVNSLVRAIGSAVASAMVGGVFAALTVDGASAHPDPIGFTITLVISGAVGLGAVIVAVFLPRTTPRVGAGPRSLLRQSIRATARAGGRTHRP